MKKFEQLTELEQKQAIEQHLNELLEGVAEGSVRFNDSANEDDLQSRIDRAFARASVNQTPWFIGEFLMEDSIIKDALTGMATCSAEDSLYLENFEPTPIRLTLKKGAF